tara:strand:- start:63 stop:1412 length:1350 start_codon:yes stop_codon:yes gene_type:complete
MSAKDPSIYEYIMIQSADGKRTVNIEPAVVGIQYFEDIFSPTITAKMLIVNTGQSITQPETGNTIQSLYNGLPVRGGERVVMKISGNSVDNPGLQFLKEDPDKHLYVSSITGVSRDANVETFTLNLVSREAITNETSRVGKKFVGGKISEDVEKIIKDELKTKKPVDIDTTENRYGFIGNMRKPFTLLTWLAAKSVPGGKETKGGDGTAGYCFYETNSGFKYKSIDSLISQEPYDKEYMYTEVVDSSLMEDDYKIIKYTTNENQDLLGKLKRGTYCSYRMYFDPLQLNYKDKVFEFDDYIGKVKPTGKPISLPAVADGADKTLGEIPSRFITAVIDRGTFDPDPNITAKELKDKKPPNANPMRVQAQSLMRYNTIMTQTISMTIPSNTNLEAGQMIKCTFPLITISTQKNDDVEQSGLYMIRALCHYFDADGSYTSLELIKDTFGEQEK